MGTSWRGSCIEEEGSGLWEGALSAPLPASKIQTLSNNAWALLTVQLLVLILDCLLCIK